MSHSTPTPYLTWAIFTVIHFAFLIRHMWKFDRFRCLRWSSGPYSGAFKRLMTYTYILTVPLIAVYSMGFSAIKYDVGYMFVEGHGIIPTPWQFWPKKYRDAILPLNIIFSVAWSFEMVTHLEELCFWLFLMNAVKARQDWFRSTYFRVWVVGSLCAIVYMPLVTVLTRSDPLKNEAYIFLCGCLGDLSLTLWFLPVLWSFPAFLEGMKLEGVDLPTLLRLNTFHELNLIRVLFRFMFVISLLILGIDGVRPHQHINDHFFWSELLAILGGIGVIVSSAITLVIFFPRSPEGEYAAKQIKSSQKQSQAQAPTRREYELEELRSSQYRLTGGDMPTKTYDSGYDEYTRATSPSMKVDPESLQIVPAAKFAPNRRRSNGDIARGTVHIDGLTENNLAKHDELMGKNAYVHNFTSPIQLVEQS
ncbi:hypothetical protein BDY19DRAFT_992234 [Irpex rosettiformis]|uniref:Uncharacterized protein n=1 Tax=Irpex rosettiformis TaxID=378272 RepID=A0ACB8U8W2_9APHY|nr:hypothetical protein BDY19DRAFT_992234 [Irpex rosettiformis]